MSDEPTRWRAQGAGTTDEIDALLRSAPRARAMSAGEYAAGARAIATIARGTAGVGVRGAVRWVALGGAVLGLSAAVFSAAHPRAGGASHTLARAPHEPIATPAPASVVAPAVPTPAVPPAPVELAAPAPALVPSGLSPRTAPTRPATRTSVAASQADFDRELALVGGAHRLLASDPSAALAAIGAYDAQFPDGQLAQERDFVEIAALVALGRRDAARVRARRTLAQDHGSAYRSRIESLLAAPAPHDPATQ